MNGKKQSNGCQQKRIKLLTQKRKHHTAWPSQATSLPKIVLLFNFSLRLAPKIETINNDSSFWEWPQLLFDL